MLRWGLEAGGTKMRLENYKILLYFAVTKVFFYLGGTFFVALSECRLAPGGRGRWVQFAVMYGSN